ncbi:MAG: purine-nucleoside phosphorylase [Flavipsychrobacter sp.]
MALYDKIVETTSFILEKIKIKPTVGIVLGSGLGDLTNTITVTTRLAYKNIPHFPVSTVEGHTGELLFGTIADKPIVMMSGRFHYYEGYSMHEVTFPIRVMKALGVSTVILSNASGGMNPKLQVGDIMIINDHINLFPEHPLRGKNDERLGTRFPDMSEPYSHHLINLATDIAQEQDLPIHIGCYAGLQGPTYETPAEYNWLHTIKADIVGMSTVPEVIVAKHGNMNVFAASIVTDLGVTGQVNTVSHEEVLAAANKAAPKLANLVTELIKRI